MYDNMISILLSSGMYLGEKHQLITFLYTTNGRVIHDCIHQTANLRLVYRLCDLINQTFITLLKVLHVCPICRPKNEKVKFQRHLKDNTNLELP